MKLIRTIHIAVLLLAVTAFCHAQSDAGQLPSRSLTVEGSYNPGTGQAGKMMPVPDQSLPRQKDKDGITYAMDSVPEARPVHSDLTVLGESSSNIVYAPLSGVAQFGYGARNVMEAAAQAMWRISGNDIMRADAALDGLNSETHEGWRSHRYGCDFGLDYTHSFKKLTAGITLRDEFSSHNFRKGEGQESVCNDSLTMRTGNMTAGIQLKSTRDVIIPWNFQVTYDRMGRKGLAPLGAQPDNMEQVLRIDGKLSMPLKGGTASIAYHQKTALYDWTCQDTISYSNFTVTTFTPSWSYDWGKLETVLGFNIDIRSCVGARFLLSPVASLKYTVSDALSLNAHFDGGMIDNSARHLAQLSPYWYNHRQTKDGYVLANLSGGVTLNVSQILTLNAWLGYRHTKDDLFQVAQINNGVWTSAIKQDNSNTFYAHMDMAFVPNSRFDVKLWADANSWLGSIADTLLSFKPVINTGMFAHVNITNGLDASLGYQYMSYAKVDGVRIKPVSDLSLRIDWNTGRRLAFYVRGGHLLGGGWQRWAGYNETGAYGVIGASYTF